MRFQFDPSLPPKQSHIIQAFRPERLALYGSNGELGRPSAPATGSLSTVVGFVADPSHGSQVALLRLKFIENRIVAKKSMTALLADPRDCGYNGVSDGSPMRRVFIASF
jgi:hypothetical protein